MGTTGWQTMLEQEKRHLVNASRKDSNTKGIVAMDGTSTKPN
jgi:hypothetical protein